MMSNFNFDERQKAAIYSDIGNVKVQAVAGSGKTAILVARAQHLINSGVNEDEILVLTFTNEAANEVRQRIANNLGGPTAIHTRTFHSLGLFLLKKYLKESSIPIDDNFDIIQNWQARKAIEKIRREHLEYSDLDSNLFPSAYLLGRWLADITNHNMPLEAYVKSKYNNREFDDDKVIELAQDILLDFIDYKTENNLMDFNDILVYTHLLLQDEAILKKVRDEYKHILVDEYQDVNWAQNAILMNLNGNNSLFVIGDSNQCIYQFRGSDPQFIDNFEHYTYCTKKYKLPYNYRSTQEILDLATMVINSGSNPKDIELVSAKGSGEEPKIRSFKDKNEEAKFIAKEIKERGAIEYENTAILARNKAELQNVISELSRAGVEYDIDGGSNIFSANHIKNLLDALEYFIEPNRENLVAFLTIFPNISRLDFNSILSYTREADYDVALTDFSGINIQSQTNDLLHKFVALARVRESEVPGVIIEGVINDFYKDLMLISHTEIEEIEDDLDFIIDFSKTFMSMEALVRTMKIGGNYKPSKGVKIMTIHSSKGLEFDYVYIVSVNSGIFPKFLDVKTIEEDRNLFYVAVTRAMKDLTISYIESNDEHPSVYLVENDLISKYKVE